MSGRTTTAVHLGIANDAARRRYWRDRAVVLATAAVAACPVEWEAVAESHLADELRQTLTTEAAALQLAELWADLIIAGLETADWLELSRALLFNGWRT